MSIHEKTIKKLGFDYYIILADQLLIGTNKKYRIDGHYFYCATDEAYEVLAHKLAIFYCYIYNETKYDFVYKVDDGCLLNMKILKNPTYDYGGSLIVPTSSICHKYKCKNKKFNKIKLDFRHNFQNLKNIDKKKLENITKIKYAGGGYGYGLSRKALSYIPKYLDHILNIPLSYEDIIFGQIMYLSGITPVQICFGQYHQIK
jgi:hypothetical protein